MTRLFIIVLSFTLLISCSNESGENSSRTFDFSEYTKHGMSSIGLSVKLPNKYVKQDFDQSKLDTLLKLQEIEKYDKRRAILISLLYQQKQGGMHLFVSRDGYSYILFKQMQYVPIDPNTVKLLGQSIRAQLNEYNYKLGTDFKMGKVILGQAGKSTYGVFNTHSSDGNSQSFIATIDMNTWEIFYMGNEPLDYESIIYSLRDSG